MNYRILITSPARAQILEQARHIAIDCQAPLNAAHWLDAIFDATDSLADFPHRCALAAEDDFRNYEIRRQLVGDYILLFTIVEETQTVWVIGFRHGSRQPRQDELPPGPPCDPVV